MNNSKNSVNASKLYLKPTSIISMLRLLSGTLEKLIKKCRRKDTRLFTGMMLVSKKANLSARTNLELGGGSSFKKQEKVLIFKSLSNK